MASDGGKLCFKSPRAGPTTSIPPSDDEISVIAVIKKGTSGIPKRARYHYIRELPLTSVKSLKKSLQKSKETRRNQARALIQAAESSSKKETLCVTTEAKKPRVIELSDEASKMELRKQFKMSEKSKDQKEQTLPAGLLDAFPAGNNNVLHKLPPGTVLIKQEPRTPRLETDDQNLSISVNPGSGPGSNTNGSSVGATTTTTSTNTSNSSGSSTTSSASSCGSGSSSGGFRSGSASPLGKVKRLHRASKDGSRKKILDVVPRRNPKRCGSKKGAIMKEVPVVPTTPNLTTMTTRPRVQRQRRLLATRRQERNEGAIVTGTNNNKRTKTATMPYMNTRSVTRKLYTVGATYQAPTRKDETEWREWPVHGLHERPVFHPQVGLAAEYAGRVFWTTTDIKGINWTYREVLDAPEDVEVVPVDPRSKGRASPAEADSEPSEESFEVCMHESLHSVLAYCAQVMAPGYSRFVENKGYEEIDVCRNPEREIPVQKDAAKESELEPLDAASTHLNLTELEDSSISDETLMEMSSIYKKLLPVEDQPSSREDSPLVSAEGSPPSGNNRKGTKAGDFCLNVSKNTSEASEIAKILSEYNESLKGTGTRRSFVSTKEKKEKKDSKEPKVNQKTFDSGKTSFGEDAAAGSRQRDILTSTIPKIAQNAMVKSDNWLEELLVDTSLLYCVATGVGQRDLKQYVDSLDAKQSLQWLQSRNG